jgi:hypothetical protein
VQRAGRERRRDLVALRWLRSFLFYRGLVARLLLVLVLVLALAVVVVVVVVVVVAQVPSLVVFYVLRFFYGL